MKVICLMAITLDGKIAKNSDHFPDWTEKADKKVFMEITKKAGNFIVGSKTFATIGTALPGRLNVVMTQNKSKIMKDFSLVNDEGKHIGIFFTNLSPQTLLEKLEKSGFSEIIVAGGSSINTLFAKENLIDELILTVSPLIFGSGLSIFSEEVQMNLILLEFEKIGENTIKLRYRVQREKQQ